MRVIRYCPGRRRLLRQVEGSHWSPYCCDDCRRGACTYGGMHPPALQQKREERLRDVYRIA
ncbi:MAG TPA: hypothetical protein VGC81_16955 [Candidatus Methylomirabilis sp.]|jgi:hypothetical protein